MGINSQVSAVLSSRFSVLSGAREGLLRTENRELRTASHGYTCFGLISILNFMWILHFMSILNFDFGWRSGLPLR
jgi:hypothetical protein